jgi:FkbM family methyltransferase
MYKQWLLARRWLLRHFVPELYWPKIVTLDGVSIPLRGKPWSYGTKWLLKQGGYEAEERALIQDILQPGMQVLEMGSSIGILTAIVAQKIGPAGRIVAVEASQQLTRHSAPWLAAYPWVTIVTGFAFPVWKLGNIHIEGFSEVRGSLGGTVSFSSPSTPTASNFAEEGLYDVETLCSKYNLQPQLLMVDVEGSERIMIDTPPALPACIRYIIMEIHPGMFANGLKDRDAILDVLFMDGFALKKELRGVYLFSR